MKKLDFYEDRPNKYTRTELTPNREFTAKPDLGPSDHKKPKMESAGTEILLSQIII
jgi:hypothetical protein